MALHVVRSTRSRTRLVAVVLVPLVAFALVAGSMVRASQLRAHRARDAQGAIERFLLADRLALRLRVERDLAVLLVRAGANGRDRSTVGALVGIDLTLAYNRARAHTDAVLAQVRVFDNTAGTARLVDVTRPRVENWSADGDSLARTYAVGMRRTEEVVGRLRIIAESALAQTGGTANLIALVAGVEYLDEYHRAAVSELGELTRLAVPQDGADQAAADRASSVTAEQTKIVQILEDTLPPDHLRTWNDLRATRAFTDFTKLHADLLDDRVAAAPPPESSALAHLLGRGIERSEALVAFTETLGAALKTDTDRIDAHATAAATHLVELVVLLALATLLLTALVVRSITRPLHQVLDVASSVAAGNLGAMSLPSTGPREVVELAEVVEVLGHNLAAIDAHARALAEGRLDDAALPVSLPGGIGSLLQLTMERLADETARLAHRARHDPLTGLLNRGAILDELALASRAGRRTDGAMVAFVDLDGFKSVNDEHGHDLGDELLVAVAERLRVIPTPATSVGRLGGDEFVAVCRYPSSATQLANNLLACFEEPFALSTGLLALKASIGVAHCAPGDDPLEGLRRADQATYVAKRKGKAQLVMA